MIVIVVVLVLLLFFLCWILFIPVRLEVDTARAVYLAYQPITFSFWFAKDFCPHLRLFGIPVSLEKKDHTISQPKKHKHRKRHISLREVQALITRLLGSIRVKRLRLDVDIDDVVTNAKLVPVFRFLSRGPVQISTNFEGRVWINLLAEVRLYRIGWAFLLFFTKHKNYGHEF